MLRESRKKFFTSIAADAKKSPKRLWSVLKRTSTSRNIPDVISSASNFNTADTATSSRLPADNPESIANLFNDYLASVY